MDCFGVCGGDGIWGECDTEGEYCFHPDEDTDLLIGVDGVAVVPNYPDNCCDCYGNVVGCDGICGSGLVEDECGVCNGFGIEAGYCGCNGETEGCETLP